MAVKTPGAMGKKGQSAPKTKEPGAPKSRSLAPMFANAKPKAQAVEKVEAETGHSQMDLYIMTPVIFLLMVQMLSLIHI